MAAYGGKTPKRHVMYANCKSIGAFDMGKLVFDYNNPEYKKNRTTKKTVSMKGGKKKVAFQGVKKKLKDSQHLGYYSNMGMMFCIHSCIYVGMMHASILMMANCKYLISEEDQ